MRDEEFFALKNPKASAGFEPAHLGTKGQHATPRPPKPYKVYYGLQKNIVCGLFNDTVSYSGYVASHISTNSGR